MEGVLRKKLAGAARESWGRRYVLLTANALVYAEKRPAALARRAARRSGAAEAPPPTPSQPSARSFPPSLPSLPSFPPFQSPFLTISVPALPFSYFNDLKVRLPSLGPGKDHNFNVKLAGASEMARGHSAGQQNRFSPVIRGFNTKYI